LALQTSQALDRFLASVERRAFVMARYATGDADDALDIVQEAMIQLVRRYAARGEQEWGPLFQRILQNRINDWFRRARVRNRWRLWFSDSDEGNTDPIQNLAGEDRPGPLDQTASRRTVAELETALQRLPMRQRQAFLLRVWEGLDVEQTARAMGCSVGSVKTHYSRAIHALRKQLEDHR